MAKFKIKTPDGTFLVTAPDEQTAWKALQSQQGGGGQAPAPMSDYDQSYFAQGTSGVNEGIGNMLGAPVDLVNAGIGLGMRGINAVAGTDMKPSDKPFLGSRQINDWMADAGSIKPQTQDRGKQVLRRVGQSVGSALIPGGAALRSAEAPLQVGASILGSSLAGGSAAAGAQQLFPGNSTAEMLADLAGSLGTGGVGAMVRRGAASKGTMPTVEGLRNAKNTAYQRVDDIGATYTPDAMFELRRGILDEMRAAKINPRRHPKAWSMLEDIVKGRMTSGAPTLTELDQLRQTINRDLTNSSDEAERFFGQKMIDNIDEFINSAGDAQMTAGKAGDAAATIKEARNANKRYRNFERVDTALTKAEHRAGSTGTGGNIDNASRQNIRAILDDPRRRRFYSQEELAQMEKIVMGTGKQNRLRQIGRLSPSGNGLQQAMAIGATAYNPAMAVFPGIGMAAKALADRSTRKSINDLLRMIATGKSASGAALSKDDWRSLAAIAASHVNAD